MEGIMAITTREQGSHAQDSPESAVRSIGADECLLELHGRNDLGELVQHGRVRLHSADGSVVEISNPTREEWRDPEGFYHVRLFASLSDEMKQRHPDPIPDDATTVVHRRDFVEVDSELYGGEVFDIDGTGAKPWQSLVLRHIRKIELVVPRDDEELHRHLGAVSAQAVFGQNK